MSAYEHPGQATVAELSQRILEMGKTGVYRESIFEALRSLATKKAIRQAIAQSKQMGLRSVAHLRDAELGTYYELDRVAHAALKEHSPSSVPVAQSQDAAIRLAEVTRQMGRMLAIARLLFSGLGTVGLLCLFVGQQSLGSSLLISATSIAAVWALQRGLFCK